MVRHIGQVCCLAAVPPTLTAGQAVFEVSNKGLCLLGACHSGPATRAPLQHAEERVGHRVVHLCARRLERGGVERVARHEQRVAAGLALRVRIVCASVCVRARVCVCSYVCVC